MIKIDETLLRVLAAVPIFAGIGRLELIALLANAIRVERAADQLFFDEGDDGQTFFVFIMGSAIIEKHTSNGWHELADLRPGDTFGEMAIVDGGKRSARVRATSDAIALKFQKNDIELSAEAAIVIYRNIARILSKRLRHYNEKL
ncbi:MAG: Crp/Fnr family transcriptional regulator [Steroidobacteraceae bacterium]|jgi:CRP-like cAMP-binding protein